MPLSTPQWWFNDTVLPNYNEYMSDPLCRRKAVNALVTTYHFWERLYEYYNDTDSPHLSGMSKKDFRKHLIGLCPDIELAGIGANAVKHQLIMRAGGLEFTATGVTTRTDAALIIQNSGERTVEDLLRHVMSLWTGWLQAHR